MNVDWTDEHDLWQALKQGEKQALSALYQRYYRSLFSYGSRLCANPATVEDAIQDLFVTLWHLKENLARVDSVKFYLFRSLRRNLHRVSDQQSHWSTDLPDFNLLQDRFTPEQLLLNREHDETLNQQLAHLLQQLPQRQLEVISLRFYENFKTHEIANIMGITEKSVRNTLHKGLSHLREQAHVLAPFLDFLLLCVLLEQRRFF